MWPRIVGPCLPNNVSVRMGGRICTVNMHRRTRDLHMGAKLISRPHRRLRLSEMLCIKKVWRCASVWRKHMKGRGGQQTGLVLSSLRRVLAIAVSVRIFSNLEHTTTARCLPRICSGLLFTEAHNGMRARGQLVISGSVRQSILCVR